MLEEIVENVNNLIESIKQIFDAGRCVLPDNTFFIYSLPTRESLTGLVMRVNNPKELVPIREFFDLGYRYYTGILDVLRKYDNFFIVGNLLEEQGNMKGGGVLAEFEQVRSIFKDNYNSLRKKARKKSGGGRKESFEDVSKCLDIIKGICRIQKKIKIRLSDKLHTSCENFNEYVFSSILEGVKYLNQKFEIKETKTKAIDPYTDEKIVAFAFYLTMFNDQQPVILSNDRDVAKLTGFIKRVIKEFPYLAYYESSPFKGIRERKISISHSMNPQNLFGVFQIQKGTYEAESKGKEFLMGIINAVQEQECNNGK